jgi:hypothetical protein
VAEDRQRAARDGSGGSGGSGGRRPNLHGYGPVLALVVAFVLMVVLVPSKLPTTTEVSASAPVGGSGGTAPAASNEGKAASGNVTPCPDRKDQVAGDSYSPPCFTFTGDNGGATSKGVSADTITVSYRVTSDPDYLSTIEAMAHSKIAPDTPADVQRTVEGLVDYFNKNFQFYGRKIKLAPFDGKGTVLGEVFGGGQDAATADAVKAATEEQPFADISALTEPYSNALTKRQVIALGAPYVSDQWFAERRPYAWSIAPSCTLVSQAATEYANKLLFGHPATYAGGDLQGKPRKIAIISPDNPEYQRCTDSGIAILKAAGNDVLRLSYSLDLTTMQSQAASLVAKLKDNGITSVGCGCDPLLPVYLTGKAKEQGYTPEWLVMGTALTDTDFAGQLYDQDEWSHAFGASALGDQLPLDQTAAYKAYTSVRSDKPANSAQLLYFQLYQLAIGIQMAGPQLTPANFETGEFNYPEHTGEAGTWKMGPGKYTPEIDARQVTWNRDKVSPLDGSQGSYDGGGKRYRMGQIPTGIDPRQIQPADAPAGSGGSGGGGAGGGAPDTTTTDPNATKGASS